MKRCPQCGTQLPERSSPRRVFCSTRCRVRAHRSVRLPKIDAAAAAVAVPPEHPGRDLATIIVGLFAALGALRRLAVRQSSSATRANVEILAEKLDGGLRPFREWSEPTNRRQS